MEVEERRRFQHNCGTDDTRRAHQECAQTSDDPIGWAQIRCPLPGAIEDQELLLDEHRLGDYRTNTAGTCESRKSSDQMKEKDDEIPHLRMLAKLEIAGVAPVLAIRHTQAQSGTLHTVFSLTAKPCETPNRNRVQMPRVRWARRTRCG
jgi:hypothetical protein